MKENQITLRIHPGLEFLLLNSSLEIEMYVLLRLIEGGEDGDS